MGVAVTSDSSFVIVAEFANTHYRIKVLRLVVVAAEAVHVWSSSVTSAMRLVKEAARGSSSISLVLPGEGRGGDRARD
jgi:hypothetical protein